MKLTINTDGGSRGNPGPSGIGFVIKDETSKILVEESAYIGETTNNVAEYTALIKGLEEVTKLSNIEEVKVISDSELMVKQLRGEYKIKQEHLQKLANDVKRLENSINKVIYTHVRREFNKEADKLVNIAIDKHQN